MLRCISYILWSDLLSPGFLKYYFNTVSRISRKYLFFGNIYMQRSKKRLLLELHNLIKKWSEYIFRNSEAEVKCKK